MDNLTTPEVDNGIDPAVEPSAPVTPETSATPFSWKTQISKDYANSPLMKNFEDSPAGLNKAIESHLSLEKMLGHEKVPIPKSADDVEGWSRFSKAMGIPDKAEGYGLPDVQIPEELKDLTFSKQKFADIVHSFKLTPAQANGLWKAYTESSLQQYGDYQKKFQQDLTQTVNQLRGEWGDAYDTNVELGQAVINKFASDQAANDWLTNQLVKHPYGAKFLAQIGNQFAENKVGEFSYKRFSLTPEQAQQEIDQILRDPNHPYTNPKASQDEHDRAIAYVNNLYAMIAKNRG